MAAGEQAPPKPTEPDSDEEDGDESSKPKFVFKSVLQHVYETKKFAAKKDKILKEIGNANTVKAIMQVVNTFFHLDLKTHYNKLHVDASTFKSEDAASEFRSRGNDALLNRFDQKKAHVLYTQSVACAPPKSESLALAFAARSLPLRQMGRLDDSIADVDHALQDQKYPREILHELLLRKAENVHDKPRAKKEEVKAAFEKVTEHFDEDEDEGKPDILNSADRDEFDNRKQRAEKSTKQHFPKPDLVIRARVPKVEAARKDLPALSSALKIIMDKDDKTQRFKASEYLRIGNVLFAETPWVMIPYVSVPDLNYCFCTHCLKRCYNLLPCPNCCWALFCSETCRAAATKQYHTIECPVISRLLLLEPDLKDTHWTREGCELFLTVRFIAKAGLKDLEKFLKQYGENGFVKAPPAEEFDPENLRTLCYFDNHLENRTPEQILLHCLSTLEVIHCFQDAGFVVSPAMAGLFLHLFMGMGHASDNYYEIHLRDTIMGQVPQRQDVGCCLSPYMRLLSLSCAPNCQYFYYGGKLVVRALEPIPVGTKPSTIGVGMYEDESKEERQKAMMKYHFTECKCIACTEDWPKNPPRDYTKEEDEIDEHWYINEIKATNEGIFNHKLQCAGDLVKHMFFKNRRVHGRYSENKFALIDAYWQKGDVLYKGYQRDVKKDKDSPYDFEYLYPGRPLYGLVHIDDIYI